MTQDCNFRFTAAKSTGETFEDCHVENFISSVNRVVCLYALKEFKSYVMCILNLTY